MNMNPHCGVLPVGDRERKRHQAELADHLDELLAIGTHELALFLSEPGAEWTLATQLLFRRLLELLGGISCQLRAGWAEGAMCCLRPLFEVSLYIDYLCSRGATPDELERRGYAFLVADVYRQIRVLRKLRGDTDEGRELAGRLANDRFLRGANLFFDEEFYGILDEEGAALIAKLGEPGYLEAAGVWEETRRDAQVKGKRFRHPEWYALCTPKARNLEELAKLQEWIGMYDQVYRPLSEAAHSNDVHRGPEDPPSTPSHVRQIRWPGVGHKAASLASMFSQAAFSNACHALCAKSFAELEEATRPARARALSLANSSSPFPGAPPATSEEPQE